jgi:hypothetical protein
MSALCQKRTFTGTHGSVYGAMGRSLHQQRQFAQDFVERQLREERQGVLDRQPLLWCERLKFGLVARAQHRPGLNLPPVPTGGFGRSVRALPVVAWFRRIRHRHIHKHDVPPKTGPPVRPIVVRPIVAWSRGV